MTITPQAAVRPSCPVASYVSRPDLPSSLRMTFLPRSDLWSQCIYVLAGLGVRNRRNTALRTWASSALILQLRWPRTWASFHCLKSPFQQNEGLTLWLAVSHLVRPRHHSVVYYFLLITADRSGRETDRVSPNWHRHTLHHNQSHDLKLSI